MQSLQEWAQRILGTPALAFPPPQVPVSLLCHLNLGCAGILPQTGSTLPSAVALNPAVIRSTESEDLGPVGEVAHFSTWPLHFFSVPPCPTQTISGFHSVPVVPLVPLQFVTKNKVSPFSDVYSTTSCGQAAVDYLEQLNIEAADHRFVSHTLLGTRGKGLTHSWRGHPGALLLSAVTWGVIFILCNLRKRLIFFSLLLPLALCAWKLKPELRVGGVAALQTHWNESACKWEKRHFLCQSWPPRRGVALGSESTKGFGAEILGYVGSLPLGLLALSVPKSLLSWNLCLWCKYLKALTLQQALF